MPVTVRRATSADAPLLSELNAEVQAVHAERLPEWFKPPGPQQLSSKAAAALIKESGSLTFIAQIEAEPIGYVYATAHRNPETPWRYAYEMVYIHQIGVRAAHRRLGAGAALIAAVRAEAASRNAALLGLDVWSFNADARAFFQRQGFGPYFERLVYKLGEAGREGA